MTPLVLPALEFRNSLASCPAPWDKSLIGRDADVLGFRDCKLLKDFIERDLNAPLRVIGLEAPQVADVADVVSDAVLFDVLCLKLPAEEFRHPRNSLKNRSRI